MQVATEVTARFAEDSQARNAVVINEISYHAPEDSDPGDWLELYNGFGMLIDVSGWSIRDGGHQNVYRLPEGTVIAPGGYLVISRDTTAFRLTYPGATSAIGNLPFDLSNAGDLLQVVDRTGGLVDSVAYQDVAPWPSAPDGLGPTLSLDDPWLDNALAESWSASAGSGTPGEANDAAVRNEVPVRTRDFVLRAVYPNPAQDHATASFWARPGVRLRLSLYDALGREVRVLATGSQSSSEHHVRVPPERAGRRRILLSARERRTHRNDPVDRGEMTMKA